VWTDGASKTIYFTPGGNITWTYVNTNVDPYGIPSAMSLISGSLPPGVYFYGDVYGLDCYPACAEFYSGSISGSATYSVVVRVTQGGQSADITVTFQPNFSLPGTVTSTSIVGSSYSSSLSASGGTSPRSYSIYSGSLPPGYLSIHHQAAFPGLQQQQVPTRLLSAPRTLARSPPIVFLNRS